jgi:hypothetical protein
MVADGLWLSRKQRRSFHQPHLSRESYGELIQIDGSDHRWFEDRGAACTLLVLIDEATSRLMQLRFVPSESTDSYFEALQGYLHAHGCPVAFYSDKHTVFRVNRPDATGGSGISFPHVPVGWIGLRLSRTPISDPSDFNWISLHRGKR